MNMVRDLFSLLYDQKLITITQGSTTVSVCGVDTSTALQLAPSSMSKEEMLCKTLSPIKTRIGITNNLTSQRLVCMVERQIPRLLPRRCQPRTSKSHPFLPESNPQHRQAQRPSHCSRRHRPRSDNRYLEPSWYSRISSHRLFLRLLALADSRYSRWRVEYRPCPR